MKFLGRNVQVSNLAKIGQNVRIGDGSVIYDNVIIGDNTVIANNCVIGEPVAAYYINNNHETEPAIIGENALIRSHAIIYEGVLIGDNFQSGHRITIREKTIIGNYCSVGTNCDLQGHLVMGKHCHLHSDVHLCQYSNLGDYVFVYPGVILTNDKHPPSETVKGPAIGNYTQIGVQSSIIGPVNIGSDCLIGAASLITKDFDDFSFVLGTPARRKCDVRELKSSSGEHLYPWKNRFSRGMPWQD